MMLDTGSQSIIVSKRFIDRLGISIERPARVTTINIDGGRTVPLGEITNVPIQIGEHFWSKNVIVNDSPDFNVVLGNKFIAPAKGEIDFLTKTFAYFKDGERGETPFTCWTRFEDPDRVYPMPMIRGNEEERISEILEENLEERELLEERTCRIKELKHQTKIEEAVEELERREKTKKITKEFLEKKPGEKTTQTKEKTKILSREKEMQLTQLLEEYSDIFVKEGELGRTEIMQHRIYTENVPPIFQRPYEMSPKENEIIRKELDKMIEQGVIKPSQSPWASPVVLVRKKDGKIRFCVDFRKINSITKKDKYPLPNIEEIMDLLGNAQWFATMDLASGYWQVKIADEDIEKTAFSIAYGLYEFVKAVFSISSSAIFTCQYPEAKSIEDIEK